jgi:hypothetical protein
MNVKISLTLPFKDIPNHIEKVLKDRAEEVASIQNLLEYSICCADIDGTLADIDDIRKRLASLDFLLADCYSILRSYKERLDGGTEQGLDDKTV